MRLSDKVNERFRVNSASLDLDEKTEIVRGLRNLEDRLAEYEKKVNFLLALEITGVDNWGGYSYAFKAAKEHGLEIDKDETTK